VRALFDRVRGEKWSALGAAALALCGMYGMVSSGPTPQAKQHHLHHGPASSRRQGLSGPASRASRATRSIYRRLLNFVKQAWTGVKFALGKHKHIYTHSLHKNVCYFCLQKCLFLYEFDSYFLLIQFYVYVSISSSFNFMQLSIDKR
jgi:hypothetical protein